MFKTGVKSLSSPDQIALEPTIHTCNVMTSAGGTLDDVPMSPLTPPDQGSNTIFSYGEATPVEPVQNITCFIMMLDILIKQV